MILQIEKKCEFENVTPAELIASNFLNHLLEDQRAIKEENTEEQHDQWNQCGPDTPLHVWQVKRFK